MISFARVSPIAVWIRRRSGRAPYAGSRPFSASQASAGGVMSSVSRRSASRLARRPIWSSAIRSSSGLVSAENTTKSSSRLRNSGLKDARTTSSTCSRLVSSLLSGSTRYWLPRLEVRIRMVLRKSTVRPWPSVRRPSSRTWSRMSKTSGWAFSTSSSSTTLYGRRRTASVSWPPSS